MATLVEPGPEDIDTLLALSNAHAREIGTFTRERFAELVALSFRTRMTNERDAFLIALAERAPAEAPNYRWFIERFERLIYIDRVVVAEHARRRGLGRLLYSDLIHAARRAGYERICCEVNLDPPNPASDAFHARLGFEDAGRAYLPERRKTVRYLIRPLDSACESRARPFL